MTDHDAVKVTIDICARTDLLDTIIDLIEVFDKHSVIPKDLLGYDLYSYAYNKAKQYNKAIEYGELALSCAKSIEEKISVNANLGKLYLSANKPTKAVAAYEFIAKYVKLTLGFELDYSAALFACGKKDESYKILKRLENNIWQYDSIMADTILFNLGVHYIQQGDFKAGIEHLAIGRRLNVFGSYSKIQDGLEQWDGKPHPGKHILFLSEGGIGDEIINSRFVDIVSNMGMKCSLLSTHGVMSIYDHMPFVNKVNLDTYNKRDYDYWTPMMGLPKTLNLDSNQLYTGPYLKAKPEYVEKHKTKITGEFKVGLRWSGNPRYDYELHRTINLTSIINSMPKDNNWSLYSLQRDVGMEQLKENSSVMDLSSDLTSFEDLLGVMENLDLIITSCTSVAHAAAALGKRTIIIIPIMEYYIWAEGKRTSSWYGDNITLIRQVSPETWAEAYTALQEELANI